MALPLCPKKAARNCSPPARNVKIEFGSQADLGTMCRQKHVIMVEKNLPAGKCLSLPGSHQEEEDDDDDEEDGGMGCVQVIVRAIISEWLLLFPQLASSEISFVAI